MKFGEKGGGGVYHQHFNSLASFLDVDVKPDLWFLSGAFMVGH